MHVHRRTVRTVTGGAVPRPIALLLALVLLVPLLLAIPAAPVQAQTRPGGDDDVIKLLLFTKQAGHNAAAPVTAVRAVAQDLGTTHGQTVEFTETADAAVFTSDAMDDFDAVVFAHTGGVLFDQAQRDGLQSYIQAGGGWLGVHYAGWSRGTSEHDVWEWYHGLVGGKSDGHPEIQTATLRAPDPDHPLLADLADDLGDDDGMQHNDEFYDWVVNPTANVHTLLEVDEFTIGQYRDPADNYDGRRNGTSHPMTWCQDYDGGRSWYTALGHYPAHWDQPVMRDMVRHGIAFTAGLVDADCSPPAKDVHGAWSGVTPWPLVPINASLTGEGLVQSFGSVITGNDTTPYDWSGNGPVYQGGQFQVDVWDPEQPRTVANVFDQVLVNTTYTDLFCSIQVWDPNRRATLTAGGDDGLGGNSPNDGSMGVTSYASRTGLLTEAPMLYPRWYPTATVLPDGGIVVQGGAVTGAAGPGVLTPEIHTPDEGPGWRALTGATSNLAYGDVGGNGQGNDENRWWYPRAFVVPGSDNVYNLSGTQAFELDPSGDGQIIDRGPIPAAIRSQGALGNPVGATSTAVMYEPGRILQVGGGAWSNGGGPDGARAGFTVDLTNGTENAVFTATEPMTYQRHWATSTVMPDGQVLVTGGGRTNNGRDGVVTNPEIWNPETGEWTTVEVPHEHARLYHSTALLLPDGRIMVGGGGTPGPWNYTDVEFYSPAYLFDGDQPAVRPVITDAPAEIGYDGVFELDVDTTAARVTLVRNGSVTHGFNNDQRFQELTFTQDGDTLTVDAPQDGTYAPPGAYMVFVFDEDGTPSEAAMLHIDPEVELDDRPAHLVDQFEYPRFPSSPTTTVDVPTGDGRMAPWTVDSDVQLIRGAAGSNGGLERVGYHLALGASGSLQRPIEDLQPGREYRLSLRYARDSRAAAGATAEVSIADLTATLAPTAQQVSQGSPTTFGTYVGTFTATTTTEVLQLASTGTGGVLVDNLVVIGTDPGLDDAPVHYRFDEGSGTSAANTGTDASTGPATLVGSTGFTGPEEGVFGTGVDLPGGDGNVVDLPDNLLAGAEDFTVSLWANPDQLSNWTALFHIGEGLQGAGSYFQIQSQTQTAGNTGLAATFKTAGNGAPEERVLDGTNDPDLIPGQDNHVVFTRAGAVGILYLNGVEVARNEALTISLADLGSTTNNWLARNGYPDAPFAGTMDEVRLYTSAISASDVAILHAEGAALRTTTAVDVTPASPSPFADPVTVTATVTDANSQDAEGTVDLFVDGTRRDGPVDLTAGEATFAAQALSPGDHDIEVRYTADPGWRDSAGTATHTVERPDVGDGVPIHYTFDEGSGTSAANSGVDPSVGPATLGGATAFTANGRFGPGVDLPGGGSGTGNQIHLPDNIDAGMDEEFSVSIWARPDALPTWVPLVQIGSSTDTFFLLQSSLGGGTGGGFGATFKAPGNPTQERLVLGTGNDLPLGEWTHVVFTMKGTTGRIYFDGELMGTRTDFTLGIGDVGVDGTTTANLIGGTSWPDPRWNGIVDDFQMFGYELTAEEIAQIAAGPPGNAAPVAGDDTYETDEDTELVVPAPGVLANDTDDDSDPLTAVLGDGPTDGTVSLAADGSFTYTPDTGFNGVDTFTYSAHDGTDPSGEATVTITVGTPPAPPGPAAPIHYTFDEGTGTTAANTGTNSAVGAGTLMGSTGWVAQGQHGPALSLPGGASATANHVRLPDDIDAGLTDTFSVSLWARPDALPNWVPLLQVGSSTDTFFLLQSNTQASGPSGFAATFKAPGNPAQERLTLGGGNDLPLGEWTHVVFTMDGTTGRIYFDGQLMGERTDFTLDLGDVGIDGHTTANLVGGTSWPDQRFDGLVDDLRIYGSTLSPEEVTWLFDGTAPNTAPVAGADAWTMDEDTTLTIDAPGVLANDTDAEEDPLTATLADGPGEGTLTLNADGSFTDTPAADFHGTDTFTYTASDGTADSAAATVTITVDDVAEPTPNPNPGPNPGPSPSPEPEPEPEPEPTTPPAQGGEVTRLSGESRYATGVAVSNDLFPEDGTADAVVLARAGVPFDALAATPLARHENGPLLLTDEANLHPQTAAEIERVLTEDGTVFILGGIAAISQDVEDQLVAEGHTVVRLAGATRVLTALAVAEHIGEPEAVLVASAEDFPDALSAGAAAAAADGLVLLSGTATADPDVSAYLAARPDVATYAVGGPAAGVFPDATPLVGDSREATSVAVAEVFFDEPSMIGLARRDEFADALTGGAHAALSGGPVLLTPTDLLHPDVEAYTCGSGADGFVYGGSMAISDAVVADFLDALQGEGC